MSTNLKKCLKVGSASTIVAIFVLLLSWQSYFNQINDSAYDFTLRVAGEIEPSSPTRIVAIDEESIGRIGPWPWPREVLSALVDQIADRQPLVIGIDIVLEDPRGDLSDFQLSRSIKSAGKVVLSTRIGDSSVSPKWRKPLPQLKGPDVSLGHVHAEPDLDGVIRRIASAKQAGGEVFSALAIEVLRVSNILSRKFNQSDNSAVRVIPEPVLIRFCGDRGSFQQVSAWELLEGDISGAELENSIVLIGATAEGLSDDWMTPFSVSGQRMSGIEVHANLIETIFSDIQIKVIPDLILLAFLILFVVLLWWLDFHFEGKVFYLLALALVPMVVAVSSLFMSVFHFWLPFPIFIATLSLVVPGLEVRKVVNVNLDLDEKISRLSSWIPEERADVKASSDIREELLGNLESNETRNRWLHLLDSSEKHGEARHERRQRLFSVVRRGSHWKLDALDFFNEELHRFLSLNDAILSSMGDVIIVSDSHGRVLYQNPAAKRLPGYTEAPASAWEYVSGLLDGRNIIDDFAAVIAEGERRRLEFVASNQGNQFHTLVLSPITDIGVVATLQDVTAQYELNQAKNDMVSLVSHELRTPLTSIQGYSEMLLKYDLVQGKGVEFLDSIVLESRRLTELIKSFLDIAYIESGRRELNLSEFMVQPLLDDIVRTHRPVAREKRIELISRSNENKWLLRADRMLTYQALMNLVSNAIKYSSSGTSIQIKASDESPNVKFVVEDQGCGIPAEDLRRIFGKFYRRSNQETLDESGFGLGLALVQEVANLHGGDVNVESEVGKGSSFLMSIPNPMTNP